MMNDMSEMKNDMSDMKNDMSDMKNDISERNGPIKIIAKYVINESRKLENNFDKEFSELHCKLDELEEKIDFLNIEVNGKVKSLRKSVNGL